MRRPIVLAVLDAADGSEAAARRALAVRALIAQAGLEPSTTAILYRASNLESKILARFPAWGRTILALTSPDELDLAVDFLAGLKFDLAILPQGPVGRHLAGRLAGRLGGAAALDAESIEVVGGLPRVTRMVYAQNLKAISAPIGGPPWLITPATSLAAPGSRPAAGASPPLSPEAPERSPHPSPEAPERSPHPSPEAPGELRFERAIIGGGAKGNPAAKKDLIIETADPASKLSGAKTLLVGGAGLGGRAGVELMAAVAEASGALWGVTRAAAMMGWAPLDRLVGVSGAMTAPERCLLLGASGAAALYAGVAKADLVASVNTDPAAPVVALSDLAATAEAREVLTETLRILKGREAGPRTTEGGEPRP
jgi:electron transfer flavoprotein alpha subunit